MGTFKELKDNWQSLGADDPFWAILSDPRAKGGRWSVDEFLTTGQVEVDRVFTWLEKHGLSSVKSVRALDFGCGAGRLTQALAKRFERCTGVDIAKSMVEAAEKLNASSNSDFVLNDRADLSVFANGSFDFIYSSIVLQHIPRPYAMGYISEFCRLLAPGGLVVFQVPIGRHRLIRLKDALIAKVALRTRLRRLLRQRISPLLTARIEMHVIPKTAVEQELIANGVKLAGLAYTNSCDPTFNGNLEISNQPRYYAHYLSGLFAGQRA